MIDALYVATSGLQVSQSQLDTISNNLANLNTVAFKKSRVDFNELVRHEPSPDVLMQPIETETEKGTGVGIASVSRLFTGGEMKITENSLDVALKGSGFFEVVLENGETALTRGGALQVDGDGYLSTVSGYKLADMLQLPPDATEVLIAADGVVQVKVADSDEPVEVGQIQLANVMNPTGLTALGQNLFLPSEKSGDVFYSNAGENGMGTLQQGFLEMSNVDLITELVDLVVAQRGYQANSHVVRAADEIMKINNSLRG